MPLIKPAWPFDWENRCSGLFTPVSSAGGRCGDRRQRTRHRRHAGPEADRQRLHQRADPDHPRCAARRTRSGHKGRKHAAPCARSGYTPVRASERGPFPRHGKNAVSGGNQNEAARVAPARREPLPHRPRRMRSTTRRKTDGVPERSYASRPHPQRSAEDLHPLLPLGAAPSLRQMCRGHHRERSRHTGSGPSSGLREPHTLDRSQA